MARAALFAPVSRREDERLRRVQVVKCDACPEELTFVVGNGKTHMNDDTIMRKAKDKGWTFRRGGRGVRCPACDRGVRGLTVVRALEKRPEAVRAALDASAGRPTTDEEFTAAADVLNAEVVLAQGFGALSDLRLNIEESGAGAVLDRIPLRPETFADEESDMVAEVTTAPGARQPSRDDKRRIHEKLTEVYQDEEVGYAGDWSDDKVAAALSVPRAWVTGVRLDLHGENAGNEAGSRAERERRKAINELRQDIGTIETRCTRALEEIAGCERALGPLKARLEKLESGK